MSYYENRIAVDLEKIRSEVFALGRSVDVAIRNAVDATLKRDTALAYQTILGDGPINRHSEAITAQCHFFIAKHLPSAGHLRFISSALRLVVLLERVGDYAVTICRESVQIEHSLGGSFRENVEALAKDAMKMFDLALSAFQDQDSVLASGTISIARQIDREFVTAYQSLTDETETELTTEDLFRRLVIIAQLERVSDQAKNLCEEIVFFLTGETKKRRPVRILFIADRDDRFSQMAVAIGRKYCGDRADFESLGREPVSEIEHGILEFLSAHAFETDDLAPRTTTEQVASWGKYDVMVSLDQAYSSMMDHVPYETVALEWWLPETSEGEEPVENAYRFLRGKIETLVETMRGKAAESR